MDDRGTHSPDPVDYPDFARLVGEQVASGKADLGILVCGSGIGMSMAANNVPGIRAANVHSEVEAQLSREHNNGNVLALGGRPARHAGEGGASLPASTVGRGAAERGELNFDLPRPGVGGGEREKSRDASTYGQSRSRMICGKSM